MSTKIDEGEESWVAGKTEQDVYETLDLPYFEPEIREARQEVELAEQGSDCPQLITLDKIVGDLHMHTTATDGKNSIEEMANAARERGLRIYRDYRSLETRYDG